MKRMVHIAGSMSPSGIGNYIMNVYRHIDRNKVQFDFILCEKREVSFDEEILSLGGQIFYITRKSINPIKNFLETKDIISRQGYDIVFRHTDISTVALDLVAAALGGAKIRIPHSHSTSTGNVLAHRLFRPLLNFISTRRFACSSAAGQWLYGGGKDFEVIMNAINLDEFKYDENVRNAVREELGIGKDQLLIGHVGNYLPVKNHLFLLDVMSAILGVCPPSPADSVGVCPPSPAGISRDCPQAKMIFVGDGPMRKAIEDRIKELSLEENVILAGVRNDIAKLLMAMDVFAFPSFYEGLPIALVEAQRAGLPCFLSTGIRKDCDVIDGLITRLPIQDGGTDPKTGKEVGTDPKTGKEVGTDPETDKNMGTDPKTGKDVGTDPETDKNMGTDPETDKTNKDVGTDPGPAGLWSRAILNTFNNHKRTQVPDGPFINKGFDINMMVKVYEEL